MIGYYNYTVYLTYVGILSAVVGIFLAFSGNTDAAVICLLVSGVCDMFDGKIARTKKDRTPEEKSFGIQIDSLCDVVCFGVFPAVLGVANGADRWWQLAIAALFVLCGVIRLAYFNVTEELRQSVSSEKRSYYTGLPITASAGLVPLLLCFERRLGEFLPIAYSILLLVLAFFYIAPINIRKPGLKGSVIIILVGIAMLASLLI